MAGHSAIDGLAAASLKIVRSSEVDMLLMLPSSTIGRILFLFAICIAIWGAMAFGRRLLRRKH